MADPQRRKVIVAPLDWGLGHATRCIPLISELKKRNFEVVIGATGGSKILLQTEFPDCHFFDLPSYRPQYSKRLPFMLSVFFQLPKFLLAIYKEHRVMHHIIRTWQPHLVISDNRYGLWSDQIPCIFITHQVNIIMPPYLKWLATAINYFNHRQIKKFDACWIPDWPDSRLTGELTSSHSRLHVRFVGPLSRFANSVISSAKEYDVVALISGPEPQRTALEQLISAQLAATDLRFLIIRGKPGDTRTPSDRVVNHLPARQLEIILSRAHLVICRSGYSSVMDLIALKSRAVFIPTPGQTEQECLAVLLERKGVAFYQNQRDFNLKVALQKTKNYSGFDGWQIDSNLLPQVLNELLNKLK